ncbi:hypothetical protein VNO77_08934 [Canavalia gladiata]|uniref:GATA-type domain-containing protein n=1 Tax=Canavalia gladiata TaxID=3824 RepID=A0AAN9MCL1_CANGL
MGMYDSVSTPSGFLGIDDFLDTTDTIHHLPTPQFFHTSNHFLSDFPSLLSDEAAELEWFSQFVDDTTSFYHSSPLPITSHTTSFPANNNISSNNRNHIPNHKYSPLDIIPSSAGKSRPKRDGSLTGDGGVRRCTHCASEKTPQWRSGPLGPKTLCNACGVRFKSGRLVPEYRPAASPTFVLTQHSNSHRKVMELRRQKELLRHQQQQQEPCYRHKHEFKVN